MTTWDWKTNMSMTLYYLKVLVVQSTAYKTLWTKYLRAYTKQNNKTRELHKFTSTIACIQHNMLGTE